MRSSGSKVNPTNCRQVDIRSAVVEKSVMDRLILVDYCPVLFLVFVEEVEGAEELVDIQGHRCDGAAGIDSYVVLGRHDGVESPEDYVYYPTVLYEVVENVNEYDGWWLST
jgi:hypothetical protein